jgi:DUF4097 and DUF4098 domain-containing protein YvlB
MRLTTIAAAALVLLAGTASASSLEQNFDKTYSVRAGALLTLDNTNGAVNIRPGSDNQIRIHAVKRVTGLKSSMLQSALNDLKINITQPDGGVKIETKYPKRGDGGFFDWLTGDNVSASVEYTIDVPRALNLAVETVNGHIEVREVTGALKLDTTNGHIEVEKCRGSLDAETTNGGIKAEMLAVSGGRPISLETTNGHVTLTVPRNFAVSVDAANTNGSISTELPISTTTTRRHSLRGSLNGGGPEVRIRTTNGGITIQAAN